ncbi:response regulator [Chloroflexota bacterium]
MNIDNTKARTILVVEDEPSVRYVFQEILTKEGFKVDVAVNGAEAKIKLNERDYDLYIIDIKMPEINGTEVYEYMSEQYPELVNRVIFASGDVLSRETQLFFEKTGRPFLFKPFYASELVNAVKKVLNQI